MATVLMDEIVETDYGQLDLVWKDDLDDEDHLDKAFRGQVNGLVGAGHPNRVYVNLARRSGGSPVRVVLHDAEPELPGPEFDDVVEVSTTVPDDAEPGWQSWAGESGGDLAGIEAGTYRLRVSARGRDAGAADEFAEAPVDEYLIELWPASTAPDAIVRVTSQNAAMYHAEWGGNR